MRQPRDAPPPNAPKEAIRPRRFLLASFGDAGHVFPMIALGARLAARGHAVCLETAPRWQPHVEAAGMTFARSAEYSVFPTTESPGQPYAAAVPAAEVTRALIRDWRPDACVADILTVAPALAAEAERVPVATLVPHIFPPSAPGFPVYSSGARLPRTRLGAALWRWADARLMRAPLELGREQYNASRRALGLAPSPHLHAGLSRELTLVATLPQLEYPRDWPAWTRVVGPLAWEPPGDLVSPPPGQAPVVLIAPSTAQDPEHTLLRATLEGLAGERVRVIASFGGRPDFPIPANAVLAPWVSYRETMPACDAVVTHGGHGTLVRALTSGCPVLVCPAGGDMGENAARAEWAGVGVRLPRRFLSPRNVRLGLRRLLGSPGYPERAGAVARWADTHDAAGAAASELEAWAG